MRAHSLCMGQHTPPHYLVIQVSFLRVEAGDLSGAVLRLSGSPGRWRCSRVRLRLRVASGSVEGGRCLTPSPLLFTCLSDLLYLLGCCFSCDYKAVTGGA